MSFDASPVARSTSRPPQGLSPGGGEVAEQRVPLLDLGPQNGPLRDGLVAAATRVLDDGRYIMGPDVAGLEDELGAEIGARHVVGVSSGSDALLVSLMALDVGPGYEVVTTPFSFHATAGAVARPGARLVFADIDSTTFNLDAGAAAAACGPRTRAVIPVHLFGRLMAPLSTPAPVVVDAAQSLGTSGVSSVATCFSFFPSKNLGGFGDAGAVATNDDSFADKVRLMRVHGGRPKYVHHVIGGNFRIDTLQAALLRVKL